MTNYIVICSRPTYYYKISSILYSNSEAYASQLLEEMFPQFCLGGDVTSGFKYSTTHSCVIRRERVKNLFVINRVKKKTVLEQFS